MIWVNGCSTLLTSEWVKSETISGSSEPSEEILSSCGCPIVVLDARLVVPVFVFSDIHGRVSLSVLCSCWSVESCPKLVHSSRCVL